MNVTGEAYSASKQFFFSDLVDAWSCPGPGNTIRGKAQFPGLAHNNTGLAVVLTARGNSMLKYNGSNITETSPCTSI